MPIKIKIPQPFQNLTANKSEVLAEAGGIADIKALIEALDKLFPGMHQRIYEKGGGLRKFINIYVNGKDTRFLQSDKTSLKDGDSVLFIPAIAGG
ncbi:MAG: MoaD/ThiS family protein [Candidatus Omnitrophota bacterium]